mgnify:FL=1
MKTYQVNKEVIMANLEGRIFPKSFTAVWKNCRMPIPKYWKVKDSNKNSTSYYATM